MDNHEAAEMFRTRQAVVLSNLTEQEKEIILRSLKPVEELPVNATTEAAELRTKFSDKLRYPEEKLSARARLMLVVLYHTNLAHNARKHAEFWKKELARYDERKNNAAT